MKYEDLQARVAEYQKVPRDDFATLIDYKPPPPIPRICNVCGAQFGTLSLGWCEIAHELELGHGDKEYVFKGFCSLHNPHGEGEEEEVGDLEEESV